MRGGNRLNNDNRLNDQGGPRHPNAATRPAWDAAYDRDEVRNDSGSFWK